MSLPTTATATIEIDAPPAFVYDLVSDVTRMGEWSPECIRCDWLGEPGQVDSTFRGRNRSGLARWSTVARVLVADRPREFTFATQYRGKVATRWSYTFDGDDSHRNVRVRDDAVPDRTRRAVVHPRSAGTTRSRHGTDPRRDQSSGRERARPAIGFELPARVGNRHAVPLRDAR